MAKITLTRKCPFCGTQYQQEVIDNGQLDILEETENGLW